MEHNCASAIVAIYILIPSINMPRTIIATCRFIITNIHCGRFLLQKIHPIKHKQMSAHEVTWRRNTKRSSKLQREGGRAITLSAASHAKIFLKRQLPHIRGKENGSIHVYLEQYTLKIPLKWLKSFFFVCLIDSVHTLLIAWYTM